MIGAFNTILHREAYYVLNVDFEVVPSMQHSSGDGRNGNSNHGDARALLNALKAREIGAVEQLYDEYGRRAYGLAYRIVGDHGAAEDAVQEAFIDLWRNAERLDPERGSLQGLLLSVVHHKAIDRVRSQRGRARLHESLDLERMQMFEVDGADDMATLAADRFLVQDALSSLPPEQSKVVELAYFSGYTQVEIASIVNVPLGTVKSRMRLAMERLRAKLQARDASDLSRGR